MDPGVDIKGDFIILDILLVDEMSNTLISVIIISK